MSAAGAAGSLSEFTGAVAAELRVEQLVDALAGRIRAELDERWDCGGAAEPGADVFCQYSSDLLEAQCAAWQQDPQVHERFRGLGRWREAMFWDPEDGDIEIGYFDGEQRWNRCVQWKLVNDTGRAWPALRDPARPLKAHLVALGASVIAAADELDRAIEHTLALGVEPDALQQHVASNVGEGLGTLAEEFVHGRVEVCDQWTDERLADEDGRAAALAWWRSSGLGPSDAFDAGLPARPEGPSLA